MAQALSEARRAAANQEVPVGAVIVKDGKIIARGRNAVIAKQDPTAHAEIIALRKAAKRLGNYRLVDCELFVTIEPCAMCAGAMVHSRIDRLVFAAPEPRAGAVCSQIKFLDSPFLNHRVAYLGGVLAAEAGELMQSFFRTKRASGRSC